MMMLDQNKQSMKYSLPTGKESVYAYDDDGNKIVEYVDEDGNVYYRETGEKQPLYSEPIKFAANINNKLYEFVWKDYGIDDSTNYAQIVASKNELPLKAGCLIWKGSDVGYKEDGETVDESSADYIVKGVADEGLAEDLFLLQRIVK